jgi:hypothetical protein
VGTTIIERCTHAESLSGFSQQAYTKALHEMSAETSEYSDCAELIQKARLAAAHGLGSGVGSVGVPGGAGGGPAGAVAPPTPLEQHALETDAHRARGTPVRVGAGIVEPGVVHVNVASAVSTLPTPLLALLILLLVCALSIPGRAILNRARARRSS